MKGQVVFGFPVKYILVIFIILIAVVVLGLFRGGSFQLMDMIKGILGA